MGSLVTSPQAKKGSSVGTWAGLAPLSTSIRSTPEVTTLGTSVILSPHFYSFAISMHSLTLLCLSYRSESALCRVFSTYMLLFFSVI